MDAFSLVCFKAANAVDVVEFKARLAEGFNLTKHSRSGKARWVMIIVAAE